jgi:predicted KAP-like P-loop ATPase
MRIEWGVETAVVIMCTTHHGGDSRQLDEERRTMTERTSAFSADSPISRASEDRLGRADFAQRIARAVFEWRDDKSIVVGIIGPWGSGKSSLLNMAEEQLRNLAKTRDEQERPIVVRFNPWHYSQQSQLLAAFFRTLSVSLGRVDTSAEAKRLGEKLMTYGRILAPAEYLLPLFPGGNVVARIISAVSGTGKYMKEVGEALEQDLRGTRDEIEDLMKERKRPTVVVMDDIDRLSQQETQQVFQLVRLNADFPYTIYLLAFDEERIAEALKPTFGSEFLEKIIQVRLDVPAVAEELLRLALYGEIDELMAALKVEDYDPNRFLNLFHSGPAYQFATLRDVKRYANAIQFTVPLVFHEVNIADFLILEIIRLHAPRAYREISSRKDLLTGTASWSSEKKKKRDQFESLAQACGDDWSWIKDVVGELFPRTQELTGKGHYGSDWEPGWHRERRVCSPAYFDVYFRLAHPPWAVTEADFRDVWESLDSPDALFEQVDRLKAAGKIDTLFEKMEAHIGTVQEQSLRPIARALFHIGSLTSTGRRAGMFELDSNMKLLRLIYRVLRRLSKEERLEALREAAKDGDLGTVVRHVSIEREQAEKDPMPPEALPKEKIQEIQDICIERIKAAIAKSTLSTMPHLTTLIWTLYRWGFKEEAKRYVMDAISDDRLPNVLELFVTDVFSSTAGERVERHRIESSKAALTELVDFPALQERLRSLPPDYTAGLTARQGQIVELLRDLDLNKLGPEGLGDPN